jgi:hypothetical protein
MAEPFYIFDTQGYFQPLLKVNPILHYLKEEPPGATNVADSISSLAPVINSLSFATLKRTFQGIFDYNGETVSKVDAFMSNMGILRQPFDLGITLDISGCVPLVIQEVKALQKRTGKKTLRVFVMTEDMNLLREFATKGDPSWTYTSLLRPSPLDAQTQLLKTLAELSIMKKQEFLITRLSSPLGKFVYLLSNGQVISYDKSTWKALV